MMQIRNTFVIFIVSGFWHGANWTFIVWGVLNALYFLPLLLLGKNRINKDIVGNGNLFPSVRETFQIVQTFFITVIAWVFFRSESVEAAFDYLSKIFSSSLLSAPTNYSSETLIFIILFVIIEWLQRDKQHALQLESLTLPRWIRWSIYYAVVLIIFFYAGNQQDFIYFQF